MNLIRCAGLAIALAVGVASTPTRAAAAWDNVFQVCCNDCNKGRASYYPPAPQACPQPCPQPEMRISYVQRCYYQPVTEYVRKSHYEPVTKQVTSYFYLVPGITALLASVMFGETLGPLAIGGMVVAVVGVALATRR